jgi:hypothetical protein
MRQRSKETEIQESPVFTVVLQNLAGLKPFSLRPEFILPHLDLFSILSFREIL